MIISTTLNVRLDIDTRAKTAALVLAVPAADGEGDVEVFRRDITGLSAADRHRLRHLLVRRPDDPPGRD